MMVGYRPVVLQLDRFFQRGIVDSANQLRTFTLYTPARQNSAPKVIAKWCGRVPFASALSLQSACVERHLAAANAPSPSHVCSANVLLMLEHPPVYTVGIRSREYSESEEERLRRLGADFCRTDRGGLITFHGPGQLVVYPILNLAQFGKRDVLGGSVRWYVAQLESTLIRLCKTEFGLPTKTSPHTGVWTSDSDEERKLAAIGIHVKRRITSHGLALNCNVDLSWFDNIVPCGLVGKGVSSLSKELGRDVKPKDVIGPFCEAFANQFQCDVERNL